MREDQELMKVFVKYVEKYPELYDYKVDAYRTKRGEQAWEKVAASIRSELKEECTVEEIKLKWKGVRSSYNRYKHKVLSNPAALPSCKKYYLYDALRFLDPFTRLKRVQDKQSDSLFEDSYIDINDHSGDYDQLDEWETMEVKPNVTTPPSISISDNGPKLENNLDLSILSHARISTESDSICKKRRHEDKTDEDCEDLQFFRSILPDIKDFTTKEKRKLKMRILQIIDDIDNERKGLITL